ncbi:ddrA (plasmid) [Pantoea eucalypti]|uniref:DdrA n=1 Tax=Pantoea eucalypti TaxID=470933 RepID=A0ABY2ZEQ5_9GAMM|nr:ddrA [Pantoea eucalypti]QGF29538.1 ddrA [Pantoea eucalypti]TPV30071.1 ddrA [Pantoea eucalypti]
MTLTALQKLDLADQLDELIIKAPTVKGLDLLDLNDQMEAIMLQLGYGVAPAPATSEPAPATVTEPQPEPVKEDQPVPEVVTDFLAGKFISQAQLDFVETLRRVGDYIGVYLELDDARQQTASWIAASGLAA